MPWNLPLPKGTWSPGAPQPAPQPRREGWAASPQREARARGAAPTPVGVGHVAGDWSRKETRPEAGPQTQWHVGVSELPSDL